MNIDEKKAENTPAGGVLIGKKDGQTIIHDEGTMSGYLVGKLHKDGGIKAVNKATGQPLEMQGGEVVITAPAVADQTKREFEGKMMTNREILSAINEKGGGVSFADGGDIPAKIHTTDCEYKFGGKVVKDTDIAHSLGMNSTLKKGKQQFSSGDSTYDVDAIYNAIKKGKLRLKTKEVETFPMKYSVYDKNYAENHKIDFRKPNGITVRTESGEEVLIDGNHRMNNAYLNGRKTMKTYYIEDPKQIAKFTKKNKFELSGENKMGGHLSKGKSLKQIAEMHNVSLTHINEELAKGLEVEKEHFSDFKERTRVAKDHLVENPNYYTILEKAGLKRGGHIQKQELVEDAKSGNAPARDLNNYNDVLDLEADGMVGMESGLAFADGGITPIDANIEGDSVDIVENGFADGGGVELPIVSYVTVSGAGSSLEKLIGNRYNSYIEFAESVEDAYKQLGKKVRSFVQLQAFDENSIALIDVSTYISDQKNTIKNFNPLTGNYKNLEKSLQNSRPRSFQKFNWGNWLLSKVTPSSSGSGQQLSLSKTKVWLGEDYKQNLELSKKIQEKAFELGWGWFIKGKDKKLKDDIQAQAFYFNDQNEITYSSIISGRDYFDNQEVKELTPEEILSIPSTASIKTTTISATEKSEVYKVIISYDSNGKTIDEICNNGKELFSVLNLIEEQAEGEDVELKMSINSRFKDGQNQDKLVTLTIGENYFQPSEIYSWKELEKITENWFNNISFSDFFEDSSNNPTSVDKKTVDAVNVEYVYPNGRIEVGATINISNLKNALANFWNIVDKKSWEVRITPFENQFTPFEEKKLIIGSDFAEFNPETFSEEQLGSKLKTLYPDLDWSYFLKEKASASNSVMAISITYDSKVNINSGGISIANNPIELYQFLKGLLNGNYKNVKIQPTGNSINANPALLYLDGSEWYGILTNNNEETALKEINKILKIIFPELNFDGFVKANSVVKTVENSIYSLELAVQKLEKASSTVVTEYNKEIYDKSLKFLYDTKATYELALKFTPESAFMYERLDILKKLADIEKKIKNIEDMKKGGAFYMLAKILEKLERGENWKQSETAQEVITNAIPQSEIDIIIRSQKFKNWFGDWEKALVNDEYDNVSKALTGGIPSVYHHGARRIKYTYREVSNGVLYLAENISYAMWFSQNATAQSEEGNYLTECFVNVKNPIDLTAFYVNKVDLGDIVRYVDAVYPMAKIYDFIPAQVALLIKTNQPTNVRMWAWQLIRSYAKFVNHIKENTPYDGFLYYENNPSDEVTNPVTGQLEENVTKAVAIFKSHQVKVVDAVLFDGGLDDWRFENGGKIKN